MAVSTLELAPRAMLVPRSQALVEPRGLSLASR